MNYTISFEPKYVVRRLIAYLVVGVPMALLIFRILSFVINFCHEVGIY